MGITRRRFLKAAGAAAFGGAGVGVLHFDRLIPFVRQPEDVVPGVATWFATTCRECPSGCGMLLKNKDARVIKCEGNPIYPVNRGRLCPRGQASLQGLYDPDRTKGPMRRGDDGEFEKVGWDEALETLGPQIQSAGRIALISDLQTGSLNTLMRDWLSSFGPDNPLVLYEAISYEGIRDVYGGKVPTFRIVDSDYLISFASDFLETWISPVEFAREFVIMREIKNGSRNGFAYIGPRVSMTATNADRRIVVPPGAEEMVAEAIVSEMGAGVASAGVNTDKVADELGIDPEDIRRTARELKTARSPLALPGLYTSAARAAALVNSATGSGLVDATHPHALSNTATDAEMTALIDDMRNGRIEVCIVCGADPAFSLPRTAGFSDALRHVKTVVSLSSYFDETAASSHWLLPSNSPLESWGDYSPYPNVTGLMQPVMGTIFDTRQTGDILIQLAKSAGVDVKSRFKGEDFYGYLRNRWGYPLTGFEGPETVAPDWEKFVQLGGKWPGQPEPDVRSLVPVSRLPAVDSGTAASPTGPILSPTGGPPVTARPAVAAVTSPATPATPAPSRPVRVVKGSMRLYAYPHIYYYDGRGANKRWLQELPEPILATVWGSWAELHPSTARKLGVRTDDIIDITHDGTTTRIPAYVWEGVAPDTVAVPMGEGHRHYGRYARDTGVNVFPLLSAPNPQVLVKATDKTKWITRIKADTDQHGRNLVQTVVLGEPLKRTRKLDMPLPEGYGWNDFYPGIPYKRRRWAMVVDVNRCVGCHACVVACYAENNIPTAGPEGIWHKRDMHWIRIDRYIDWDRKSAPVLFEPMLCQQCDAAPCEPVCPVYASAHNKEGINTQVYNRCVGTRDCSNNCPYKVRRFGWMNPEWPPPLNWQLNPYVTVRCRGVMEKCTFCIQRIRQTELVALRENRELRDGEVTPACVETCPASVFTFGDLLDRNSAVSQLIRNDPRAFQVLVELNTKPAVIYLKRILAGQ